MSLSDKIINGIMGTNIRTIKVSVEQLAQIVNETIIAATTNEEELRAIEKAIKGSHFFISGDLESSDGKFLFHISLYQRSLKHRTVWVKNLQTEEIFEWNGFSLGPFKRAMQPYLVNARMHPPISWYRDQIIQDAVNAMDGDPAEAQDPAEAYDSEEMSESIPNETAFYEPFNKPMPMPRRQNPAVIGVITVVVLIVIGVAASMYEENMKEKQAARQKELEQEYQQALQQVYQQQDSSQNSQQQAGSANLQGSGSSANSASSGYHTIRRQTKWEIRMVTVIPETMLRMTVVTAPMAPLTTIITLQRMTTILPAMTLLIMMTKNPVMKTSIFSRIVTLHILLRVI